MSDKYKIAIVGSGPAGVSAAARAAESGVSHVLLEGHPHLSNTIFLYQKGKHVMDEPDALPLRSPLTFSAGTREQVLGAWDEGTAKHKVNVVYQSEVTSIEGVQGKFKLGVKDGKAVEAEYVVLSIGLQGNLRKMGVDGDDHDLVQYQLDDPDEYDDETIVVVGAGDAAIENAVALAPHNQVFIVNRRDEFARAKDGNLALISKNINDGNIECYYSSNVNRVEHNSGDGPPMTLVLDTLDGEAEIPCDRIIARLGAIPPRRFVESCGIQFPNDEPASVPVVSPQYESNVPGLFIIGALAGFPLIKQAMNQGYEVVEFIQGNDVQPADEPLLRAKLEGTPGFTTVDEALQHIQGSVPLLAGITPLQLREFMIDSEIRNPGRGEVIFERNDYTNSFFSIVDGEVQIQADPNNPDRLFTLRAGEFFGEMGLISGRRRTAMVRAGRNCVLIETPRRSMNKLINSVDSVKRVIDETFILRAIQTRFAPGTPVDDLRDVVKTATIQHFKPGDVLFEEGDDGDCLHLVRMGSVTVSRNIGGEDLVLSYVPAGNYVGEMALMGGGKRSATVKAAIATETIRLDAAAFQKLMDKDPDLRLRMETEYRRRTTENLRMQSMPGGGDIISFLVQQGVGEATDILLIDESLCVRCDNCEKACAETHNGISRLDREAGPTYAMVHVPTSCRHCEHPHCMKDCPPDAIHRAPNGEVYIADNCIGCGNCERNCPYGVIQMGTAAPEKPSLLSWLLTGAGPGPGEDKVWNKEHSTGKSEKTAVKCDMCKDLKGGPACVRACPTGAAIRINPEDLTEYVRSH
ncbi:MAG: cyclic nucleotide-binding domain-containing protein [Gammaproteobacteria bacterium]|nr:MAG: cyclic nucleotide-binding domain-containing protein [Gammaproteobacteria bacterium]